MSDGEPDAVTYPWQLDPKLASAIWGGGELVRDYGKHGDPHAKIGESWECWDAAKAADVLNYRAGGRSTLAQIDYHFEGLERTAQSPIADACRQRPDRRLSAAKTKSEG